MFDREGFKAYVGINSGNSYASGLESIEKEYGVDIDFEIGKDHGAQLLARINVDKKLMTGNDRKNRQNWYSHLKKYISYKEGKADTEWMPFYAELADQLLEYKQNRQELLACLHRLFQDLDMKSPFMEKDTPMTDVDPFTVFGCFNKGISDANRVKILKAFKRAFSINAEVPENFSGIPVLNNFMAAFFAFKNNPKRSPHDIDNLWELFQAATDYADVPAEENKDYFIDCFDRVKEQPVIRWNITMGLFWIRPYSFINLDERNREYLGMGKAFPPVDQMIAGKLKGVPAGAEYLEIIGLCKDAFRKTDSGIRNFVDLSRRAWIATNSGHAEPGEALAVEDDMGDETMTDVGLNTILYGPPGTGKTYHTVIYAVAIIENRELEAVAQEEYAEVLERYNEYKTQGRIEFTTFHQSYGYEEFIEGIRPDVVDDGDQEDGGDIRYSIQPGVFKKFCEKAERPAAVRENSDDMGIRENANIWKVSIEGAGDNLTRKECLENGHIRIGWDEYGKDITDDTVFHYGGKAVLNAFINKMQIGDIVLSCYSASTIDAIGVVTGEYEWNDHYEYYRRVRNVKWLAKGIRENILDMNGGKPMTLSSVYRLSNIAIADVYRLIEKYQPAKLAPENPAENYVFIIDEINRGNISKIFGELITLIEATKRVGLPEGMKAVLPYSQKPFGVPKNVYIIGTMNTADRSIATIDTALRRRFLFREMMPQPDVLAGVSVEDLNVSDMLTRINKRISVLYDREHTVGHAYFMPLKDNPTMEVLAEIFTNNIIPLLQEYFYEDYEKIRLVLGDNRKDSEEYQFIIARENDYSDLFGDVDVGLDDGRSYEINYSAFSRIEAYRAI